MPPAKTPAPRPEDIGTYHRIDEAYILQQYEYAVNYEYHRDAKNRLEELKRAYRGDWTIQYADGSTKSVKPIIENLLKNAVHDISGLAHSARSTVSFIPTSEDDKGIRAQKIRESIADTQWEESRGRRNERLWYMDLVGAGMAVAASSYRDGSPYPLTVRLDPAFCYPDVRHGVLESLLYIENVKLRSLAAMFPGKVDASKERYKDDVRLIEFYNPDVVIRAAVLTGKKGLAPTASAVILETWEHHLECIPVAFVAADTLDGAFRGQLDQVQGPLTARNDIVQLLQDYIEAMVHAPFEEKNVINADDEPGPFTIYHHDPAAQESFMRRVPPSQPAGSVFGLIQYLEQQASGESVQPPARQGQVQQSIASGSFVNSTLGRLTTVVEELQELMADLRRQSTYIAMEIDEKWLDFEKPMIRPVGRKRQYTPSKDISGYHFCRVSFGAMSGLTKLDADVRVLQHLGAKLISRREARSQIDYLDDPMNEENAIAQEAMQDSFLQRIAADPNVPPGVIAGIMVDMANGKSLIEAVQDAAPDLIQPPAPAPAEGMMPPPGQAPEPGQEQAALQAGQTQPTPAGPGVTPQNLFAPPPFEQIAVRNNAGA